MVKAIRNAKRTKVASDGAEAGQDAQRQTTLLNGSQLSHVVAMHRLLKASYLITQPFFTNFADRYDVSMNELRIIMTLAAVSNAAAHEIGRATGMHQMNVSRAVASLTAAGRVSQRRDATIDRRRKIISLTAKGWTLHNRLLPHVKKMSEFIFASMTELEVEFLSKLLRRMNSQLQDIDPSSPLLIDADAIKAEGEVGAKQKPQKETKRAPGKSRGENE
jgi:DNA-binding MarR family transcriptional regulator